MSELLELQHQLQDTSGTIAQLERALLATPDSVALQLNLQSVVKRFAHLEEDFKALATRTSLDICTYRVFAPDRNKISLRGVTGALHDFQIAFSALFDAIKNGRRLRSRLSPDVVEATSFGFGYAFAGSVGVVLTMERERALFGGSLLEDTVNAFFGLAHAPTHEEIKEIGRRLGPAPLRAVYKWANAHVEDGLGADISWQPTGANREPVTLFVQHQELQRLSTAIAATSEETREAVEYTGVLTGADTQTRRFRFDPDGAEDVSGTFADAINEAHTVTLPSRYKARLEKVTRIQYSSEQEQVTWTLLSLERP